MSALQTGDDINTNDPDPNNSFPIDSLRLPLDGSMRIVFTGYYNGFSVEVRSEDEVALLYHMGCFGKGSASRSKPRATQSDGSPSIMRKRQFCKRSFWYRKFGGFRQTSDANMFLKEIDDFSAKIIKDSKKVSRKDVIDLVSSEEEMSEASDDMNDSNPIDLYESHDKEGVVVIVPDSDSEADNYFENMQPKCCLNKIKLQEKLMLTLHEAFFLLYGLGCLQIVNFDNSLLNIQQCWNLFSKTDRNFIPKYVVYHYFRSKGYVVKPGIKFGGDFLLYKEGPGVSHADYIVVIKYNDQGQCQDWISILGHVRMATTTVKEILIAEVISPSQATEKLPEDLKTFSVREILLSRKIPVSLNEDIQ